MEKIDFNMRHSKRGRALVGRNPLKIFLIHFFEILTAYYSSKNNIIEAFVQHKINEDPLLLLYPNFFCKNNEPNLYYEYFVVPQS